MGKDMLLWVVGGETVVGSWPRIPDPDTEPHEFLEVTSDIGFHVGYGLLRGGPVSVEWSAVAPKSLAERLGEGE